MKTFAERLAWLRSRLFPGHGGIARMARSIGIGRTVLSSYEHGVTPSADNLALMVKATGCNPHWLLSGEGLPFLAERAAVRENGATYVPISESAPSGKTRAGRSAKSESVRLPPDLHAVPIRGGTLSPVGREGQIALCTFDPPRNGDLAVVELNDGTILFKRVEAMEERILLLDVHPTPESKPLVIKQKDIRQMRKVVGILF